jgi:hypothetical protein
MNNDRHKNKIETELLSVMVSQNNGSVLARFEDWAAARSPEDVVHGLRLLGRNAGSLQIVRRKRSNVVGMPKR